jgi:KaiC/GvpD/RAD55 family RecA-like ATPase
MGDVIRSLRKQLAEAEESLRLILERKSEFVQETEVPLQLIKDERRLEAQIGNLRARLTRLAETPCPYRGLEPFEAKHAEFYFGREAMVERLVAKVGDASFVAVVGPSGCGKSSLVRAGLVAALRDGALPGSRAWAIHIFRPGRDPLLALATLLVALLEPGGSEVSRLAETRKLADHLREGTLSMDDVVARLHEVHSDLPLLLLVADQFEELYTECNNEACRRKFIRALLAAAESGWVTVLLTLRADFYGCILEDRPFGQAVDAGLVNVLRMSDEELRAAIEKPALRTCREFEPGLVERILDDVAREPGNLPLLQFALTQLWERQESGRLTHAAYEEIGRVEGALTRYADQVYVGLSEAEQNRARRVFVQLVRPGEGSEDTRRLAARAEVGETDWELVGQLADARLVVTDRDPAGEEVVEVAHEALIRSWGRLRNWMDANRAFRVWQERLRVVLRQWEASGRDVGALLRGVPLAEAERWLWEKSDDLNPDERRYIQESVALREREQAARKRERVLFNVAGGLLGGVLGGLVGAIISFVLVEKGFDEDMLGYTLGGSVLGAVVGSGISFGIGLGGVLGVRGKIFPVVGGIVAGMLLGAPLGPLFGIAINPEYPTVFFVFLGVLFGAAYGGGIALSVAIGKRFQGWKRILAWALGGALVGGLVGATCKGVSLSASVGLGIALGIGILDARFQPKAKEP